MPAPTSSDRTTERFLTVSGYVTALEWDEDDVDVTDLAIITDDDNEYKVRLSGQGEELTGYLDEYVVVHGNVHRDQWGNKVIEVRSFDIGDWPDKEDEADGW